MVSDELWYRAIPSKDQYSGVVLGLTAASCFVEDEQVQSECQRLLVAMARNLVQGDFRFRDGDGEVPKFCDIRPRFFGIAIGVNAAIASGLLESAARFVDDAERQSWRPLRSRARRAVKSLHFEVIGIGNYNNDAMAAAGLITLALSRGDGATGSSRTAARQREEVDAFLDEFTYEGNALFVSAAVFHGVRDPRAEEAAYRNLLSAPMDGRVVEIPEARYRGISRQCLPDRKGKTRASRPLPLAARPRTSFVWRSDPYVLDRKVSARGEVTLSPVDFYVGYWLARASGWVGKQGQNPPLRPGT